MGFKKTCIHAKCYINKRYYYVTEIKGCVNIYCVSIPYKYLSSAMIIIWVICFPKISGYWALKILDSNMVQMFKCLWATYWKLTTFIFKCVWLFLTPIKWCTVRCSLLYVNMRVSVSLYTQWATNIQFLAMVSQCNTQGLYVTAIAWLLAK